MRIYLPWRRRHHHDHHHHDPRHHHYQYPTRRLTRRLIIFTILVTFCAFVLELLPAISIPIVKDIWLASIHAKTQANQPATAVATEIRVGVWGFCAISVLGDSTCIGPQLGYTLEPALIELVTDQVDLVNAVLKGLTVLLILHPIVAGLSFITMFIAVTLENHAGAVLCLITSIVTGLVGGVSLAADLALAIVARDKVPGLTDDNFTVELGNAIWMMLVAFILTWVAVILISLRACTCCGIGRRHYRKY
ncbi:hypothetical protein PUNSTDRAFT_145277 [Punctularia strigosozonata HHB-11173 SS5]|uniref:uncharacterized protein n=1 Tax=Punctularia strigosozonata (strain HHB-11173) TaxID=741275 RepID=UPI0004418279|nr:uncharacterized protein PUNSTDRAFT_145277 [Punctularia strigosozonata HHB-11173 SS5]EIN06794.1 hypothetical protein PUNSTDRAFT_145277 [Punctularia strigosozonata HHB-11173 SS5]